MFIEAIKAVVLGIVEGVAEFLPISSTGHLILVNQWISFSGDFTKMFDIIIQLGAVLAVIIYYWHRLWPFGGGKKNRVEIFAIWKRAIVGVVPAIIVGGLFGSFVEKTLFSPWVVAGALVVGGAVLVIIERRRVATRYRSVISIPWLTVLFIGLIQCLSLVPGTSRAAATIIGAMILGASRATAVEFSFFLAIPTMLAASVYSLVKHGSAISGSEIVLLTIGFVSAFVVASVVIRYFISYVQNNNFKPFGYYRVVLGLIIITYFLMG